MKKTYRWVALGVVGVLAMTGIVLWTLRNDDLAAIRAATRDYRDLEVAKADGYQQLFECIDHSQEGAMGVHYIMPSRFDDRLSLSEPEVLVYDVESNGEAKLVAVEYVIPGAAWNKSQAPTFLGQELKYKTTMGPHELDPYYEVHVWAWHRNPSGLYADWNPRVTCPSS
jgi:hypothetical protein